jgi:hypothetical protein
VRARYGDAVADDPGMADVRQALSDGYRKAIASLDEIAESMKRAGGTAKVGGIHFDGSVDEIADMRKHQIEAAESAFNRLALIVHRRTKAATGLVTKGLNAAGDGVAFGRYYLAHKKVTKEEYEARSGKAGGEGQSASPVHVAPLSGTGSVSEASGLSKITTPDGTFLFKPLREGEAKREAVVSRLAAIVGVSAPHAKPTSLHGRPGAAVEWVDGMRGDGDRELFAHAVVADPGAATRAAMFHFLIGAQDKSHSNYFVTNRGLVTFDHGETLGRFDPAASRVGLDQDAVLAEMERQRVPLDGQAVREVASKASEVVETLRASGMNADADGVAQRAAVLAKLGDEPTEAKLRGLLGVAKAARTVGRPLAWLTKAAPASNFTGVLFGRYYIQGRKVTREEYEAGKGKNGQGQGANGSPAAANAPPAASHAAIVQHIASQPGAKKLGLSADALAKLPPDVIADMARQLGIAEGVRHATGGGQESVQPSAPPTESAPPEEVRHPSKHDGITYGHADDRDSDDAHFDRRKAEAEAAVANVRKLRAKLEQLQKRAKRSTPEVRKLARRLAQADQKVAKARERLAAVQRRPAAGAATANPAQANPATSASPPPLPATTKPAPAANGRPEATAPPRPTQPPKLPSHVAQAANLARRIGSIFPVKDVGKAHKQLESALRKLSPDARRAFLRMTGLTGRESPKHALRAVREAANRMREAVYEPGDGGKGGPATPAVPKPSAPAARSPASAHARTQQTATDAANAVLAAAKTGDKAAARLAFNRATQALEAHLRAGTAEIERQATARYGNTPKARAVADATRRAFVAKLRGVVQRLKAAADGQVAKAWEGEIDLSVPDAGDGFLGLPWLVKAAHDVSGEKRDEDGRWTSGGDSTDHLPPESPAHVEAHAPKFDVVMGRVRRPAHTAPGHDRPSAGPPAGDCRGRAGAAGGAEEGRRVRTAAGADRGSERRAGAADFRGRRHPGPGRAGGGDREPQGAGSQAEQGRGR